jgi:hypothetical protein
MGATPVRRAFLQLIAVPLVGLAIPLTAEDGGPAASPPQRTRITIRGSGRDVRLEGLPARPLPSAAPEGDVLADLVRLHRSGASEDILLAYVRSHRSEIPAVLDREDYAGLRRAGIGEGTLRYLTTVAAIDVGPTGEPGEAGPAARPEPQETGSAANELGYPYYGDYGFGYGGGAPFGAFRPRAFRGSRFHALRPSVGFRPFREQRFARFPPRMTGGRTTARIRPFP